jgi:hypothetical protein
MILSCLYLLYPIRQQQRQTPLQVRRLPMKSARTIPPSVHCLILDLPLARGRCTSAKGALPHYAYTPWQVFAVTV